MKAENIRKGLKVVIRLNPHEKGDESILWVQHPDTDIIGHITEDLSDNKKVPVKYYSAVEGAVVTKSFDSAYLEEPTLDAAITIARYYNRQAVAFRDLAVELGYVPKKVSKTTEKE